MDSQSSHDQEEEQRLYQHLDRAEMRYLIQDVICERMQEIIDRRWHEDGASQTSPMRQLSGKERRVAQRQTRLIESMLYRRASCIKEYQDLTTLEDRVLKARHAVCVKLQRMQVARR